MRPFEDDDGWMDDSFLRRMPVAEAGLNDKYDWDDWDMSLNRKIGRQRWSDD
jgi:hypothetical protein